MAITCVSSEEVRGQTAELLGLGFDSEVLFSDEALCASLRRAASFGCPASPRAIVDAVLDVLVPLASANDNVERARLNGLLDALVSCGDLLELEDSDSGTGRQIYLAPPSFIEKTPGEYLLIGVKPNGLPLIDEGALGAPIWYVGHTRTISLEPSVGAETLAEAGIHPMTDRQWIQAPKQVAATEFLEGTGQLLARAGPSGPVNGLEIIDRKSDVHYYRGRWREPEAGDTGVFIGRRPQAYGAPRWCAVLMSSGVPQKLVDFPTHPTTSPGRDDALRLQAALDSAGGNPQVFQSVTDGESNQIDLFGPVPSWAERYLDLLGDRAPKGRGALFSYRMTYEAIELASQLLSELLWMAPTSGRDNKT